MIFNLDRTLRNTETDNYKNDFQKDRIFGNLFKMIFSPGPVRVQQLGASVGRQSGLHPVGRLREWHSYSHQVFKALEHLRQ